MAEKLLPPLGLPDPNAELIPLPLGLPKTFLFASGNRPLPCGIEFGPFDRVADENPDGITLATSWLLNGLRPPDDWGRRAVGVGLGRGLCVGGLRVGDGVGLGGTGCTGRRVGVGLAVVKAGTNDANVVVTVSTTLLKNDGLLLFGNLEGVCENSGDWNG